MIKIYTFMFLFLLVTSANAQTEINTFNSTGRGYSTTSLSDYQCLGVNPANLGWTWDNHTINIGFLEIGASLYTNALTKNQVLNNLFDNKLNFTPTQKSIAAASFSNTRLWSQAGITWLGFSYFNEKAGGFAFSIRDRALWNTYFDSQTAQFIFLGYNAPYFDSLAVNNFDTTGYSTNPKPASLVYGGSKLQFIWYREYNFGYGRKIVNLDNFKLYAGIGVKYLAGYGSFEFISKGGELSAYSALGPEFAISYSKPTPSAVAGSGVKKIGDGYALDFGITVEIFKKIRVGMALNDIGSLTWNGNVYEGQNTRVYEMNSPGIYNYDLFSQGQLINAGVYPGDPELWGGVKSKTVRLPMHFRGGASIRIIPQIEAGIDLFVPLDTEVPGAYDKSVLGLGGKIEPVKFLELSVGLVTGADVGVNIPFGITFYPIRNDALTWQLGLAMRDVAILFKDKDMTLSFALGFFRFSFGKKGS